MPKKHNDKKCSNYWTIALISHASKVMLKVLQTRLQQYMNCDSQWGKGSESSDSRKTFTILMFWLWKMLKEMGIPDHLTCLMRNLYSSQEAAVRTRHGTTDWFQIKKEVRQGCILSPCLFNLYAEFIIRNAGLDEAQAGIKIAGRNINNLRYADDTTFMAERE